MSVALSNRDIELMGALLGMEKAVPSAGAVEQMFRNRLSNMADRLTDAIDKRLTDPAWLANTNNYYLNDESVLRYSFCIRNEIRDADLDDQYPEKLITDYLVKYYTNLGWNAEYNEHGTDLKLSVRISPIKELE